jgi:integrase
LRSSAPGTRRWDRWRPKAARARGAFRFRPPCGSICSNRRCEPGRDGEDLVVGSSRARPFTPTHVRKLALAAWEAVNVERREEEQAELKPIGLHELRHSYVSLMHDAGFSLERIGDYVGHSSAYMTDACRHLLDGHEAEAAERFEDYLTRAANSAPIA